MSVIRKTITGIRVTFVLWILTALIYPFLMIFIGQVFCTIEDAVEAMKLGAVDFLQKPFTPKERRVIGSVKKLPSCSRP